MCSSNGPSQTKTRHLGPRSANRWWSRWLREARARKPKNRWQKPIERKSKDSSSSSSAGRCQLRRLWLAVGNLGSSATLGRIERERKYKRWRGWDRRGRQWWQSKWRRRTTRACPPNDDSTRSWTASAGWRMKRTAARRVAWVREAETYRWLFAAAMRGRTWCASPKTDRT